MPSYDAMRLGEDGPEPVRLRLERDQVVEVEAGRVDAEPTHWVLRAPLNAHTHVGDAFLTDRVPDGTLHEIVAPPDGFKHRALAEADPDTVLGGVRTALAQFHRTGCRGLVDFREGGPDGVALLRRALDGLGDAPTVTILGRPAGDADALDVADGYGVSALGQADGHDVADLAAAAHAAGKPFAIHASEDRRDPIEDVLALEPDLVIHLSAAEPADVAAVADAGVPVAVCPVSNRRFGLTPPIPDLIAADARWAFGTDNAMFGSRSLFEEAAMAQRMFPDIDQMEFVKALEAAGWEQDIGLRSPSEDRVALVPMDPAGRIHWWEPVRVVTQRQNTADALARRNP